MAVDGAFARPLEVAGAVRATRGGREVIVHFGSPSAELAVCLTRSGVVPRGDLTSIALTADRRRLDPLVARIVGTPLAAGGLARIGGTTWWCRSPSGGSLRAVLPAARAASTREALSGEVAHRVGGTVEAPRSVLQLVGPTAPAVLADLGAFGVRRDPARTPPHLDVTLGGRPAFVVAETVTSFLVVVDEVDLAAVWHAIVDGGRDHGLCPVGLEAAGLHAARERQRARTARAPGLGGGRGPTVR
ncbi:hypothetical protein [Patulibacter defluvii]|uniref:hypothetical protein n=1 Tax=Patulibacter defluvii TaxID=3095358 RepID=UPI002A758048|nr:hypothetical protein [Patulibacter sp. DM4]